MKAVQVQYTVKPEYVEQNKANINRVMAVLKENPIEGMQYASFLQEDGQTFVHINMCRDEATMARLNSVSEFQDFQKALKASQPIVSPKATQLNLVGAGFKL